MSKTESIRAVGKAFKNLPDDMARLEVLSALCQVMWLCARDQSTQTKQWLQDARDHIRACGLLWHE